MSTNKYNLAKLAKHSSIWLQTQDRGRRISRIWGPVWSILQNSGEPVLQTEVTFQYTKQQTPQTNKNFTKLEIWKLVLLTPMKDITPNSKLMLKTEKNSVWKGILGLERCLSGKGTCCQVQGPEFDPWDPNSRREKLNSPTSCPLTSVHTLVHTHTQLKNNKTPQNSSKQHFCFVVNNIQSQHTKLKQTKQFCSDSVTHH